MSAEHNTFMARVAEQAERFEDMVEFLNLMIKAKGGNLTNEERNLLSVGFKNLISSARSALRQIQAIATNQNAKYASFEPVLMDYKKEVEGDLKKKCSRIIEIVKEHGIPGAPDSESKAFYHKMIADYYRYIAENASGDDLEEAKKEANESYAKASEVAEELQAHNPIRLGLALNYSVFYFEIMQDSAKACELAQKARDDVSEKMGDISGDQKRDAENIVELLRDNLALWTQEGQAEDI